MIESKSDHSYILFRRWYDSQWKKWDEWDEVTGDFLIQKYGETPEQWKESCKAWIDCGGLYEYKIAKRVDTVEWEMSYKDLGNKEKHYI